MSKATTFIVKGKGRFPIDMLRYDDCWPVTAVDSGMIEDSLTGEAWTSAIRKGYKVKLTTNKRYGPTEERWNSFMFKVEYPL